MSFVWPSGPRRGGGAAATAAHAPARFVAAGELGVTYAQTLALLPDQSGWEDGWSQNRYALADLVAHRATVATVQQPVSVSFGTGAVAPAQLRTAGAMTALIRFNSCAAWVGGVPGSGYGFMCSVGDYLAGLTPATGDFSWSLLLRSANLGSPLLRYYASINGATIVADANPVPTIALPYGAWHVASLRRNSAGDTVTLGVDGSFVTVGGLAVSGAGAQGKLGFCDAYGSTSNGYVGQLGNFAYANTRMSDDQVRAIAGAMLGRDVA